jgi:molybdate transport system substrate-binding protein
MVHPSVLSRRVLLCGAAGTAATLAAFPIRGRAQTALSVHADPSLKAAMQPLMNALGAEAGTSLLLSFGDVSSATAIDGVLAHDVVIVAGAGNMARLVAQGFVERPTDLVTNGLALAAAPDRPGPDTVTRAMDLTRWVNGRHPLAVVDPERNALGEISLQALRAIGWGEGVSKRVRLAPGPGAVLDWVAHGDAALGVALANAARRDQRVRWVGDFPPDTHPPIRYQVAVRAGTPVDAPARAFVHALYGETAREAFRANGLTPQVPR